jgi:sugar phosphate permease
MRSFRRRPFYGWAIVGVAGLTFFASGPGQSFGFSVFIDSFIADTGLSRTEISALYTVGTGLSAVMVMLVGRAADRIGPRWMLLGAGIAMGIACFGMAFASGPIAFFLAFAALRALGQGSLPVNGTLLVAQWFARYRGRAMAIMGLGGSASTALLPPVAQFLIETFDWRTAYMFLGVMVWVLVIPLALFVARNRPEEMGLLPDGEVRASRDPVTVTRDQPDAAEPGALRSKFFWVMTLSISVPSLVSTAFIFHQISILTEFGLTATVAAGIFVPFSLASAASGLLGGYLVDRFNPKRVFTANLGLLILVALILVNVSGPGMALLFAVVHGLFQGIQMVVWSTTWAYYYGRQGLGRIQGTASMVNIVASAVGPLPLAALHQFFGSYHSGVLILGLLPIAAILGASLVHRDRARQY